MNFGEWQSQLIEVPGYDGYKLYMFRRLQDSIEFLTEKGTTVKLEHGALDTGDNHFAFLTREQTQSIADAFANKGIRTDNDKRSAGLLEAKDAHLQDMRQLTFEATKAITQVITAAKNSPEDSTEGVDLPTERSTPPQGYSRAQFGGSWNATNTKEGE